MDLERVASLRRQADTKIVLVVVDGLGGLPLHAGGETALEAARTPTLDALAREGVCGLHQPVAAGVTPGSGPAHLALFGYDPLRYEVGRGVLSALGIGFDLEDGDIAARGNFCTLDDHGAVVDRRAGRLDSDTGRRLCERLGDLNVGGVEVFVEPVKEYRLLLVLRGDGLSPEVADTDPQRAGVPPRRPEAATGEAARTAEVVADVLDQARERLADAEPADAILVRGFSRRPTWPTLPGIYGVSAAAVATYPMYRGVASLVGMEVLETGSSLADEIDAVVARWNGHDFFFVHFKPTDSAGEDGDGARKVELIEALDAELPRLLALSPDVVVVTGDHSTPCRLKNHSWHPVPVVLWASTCRPDAVETFGERPCMAGGLGPRLPATELMPLAFAHGERLRKFGA